MGRLKLNVLLLFAQPEREVIGEHLEIFIESDFDTLPEDVGASLFSTFPVTCFAKPPLQQHDVPRNPVLYSRTDDRSATRAELKSAWFPVP
jgi:hypothetical protein